LNALCNRGVLAAFGAAPMVGGMITAPLLSNFVIPAVYLLLRRPRGLRIVRLVQKRTGHEAG
jgi:hypothetical protein